MTCEACAEAEKNPNTGLVHAGCMGCTARSFARMRMFYDAAKANCILPAYKSALQARWGEKWLEGHEQVKAWAERLGKSS